LAREICVDVEFTGVGDEASAIVFDWGAVIKLVVSASDPAGRAVRRTFVDVVPLVFEALVVLLAVVELLEPSGRGILLSAVHAVAWCALWNSSSCLRVG